MLTILLFLFCALICLGKLVFIMRRAQFPWKFSFSIFITFCFKWRHLHPTFDGEKLITRKIHTSTSIQSYSKWCNAESLAHQFLPLSFPSWVCHHPAGCHHPAALRMMPEEAPRGNLNSSPLTKNLKRGCWENWGILPSMLRRRSLA